MSNNQDDSGTSFINIAAYFIILFIGPLAVGGLISNDYNPPAGIYIVLAITIIYLYQSNRTIKNRSEYSHYQSSHSTKRAYQHSNHKKYQAIDGLETNVVGVTYENRQIIISRLQPGEKIKLVPEPSNPHDPNAIKVCTYNGTQIGYINKDLARKIVNYFPTINDIKTGYIKKIVGNRSIGQSLGVVITIPNLSNKIDKGIQFSKEEWDEAVTTFLENDYMKYGGAPMYMPWMPPDYDEVKHDITYLQKLRIMAGLDKG